MSVKQMSLVWDLDLAPNKRLVLLAYADHADDDGDNVYPSLPRIARKTGYGVDQVRRISRELVADGLMELVEAGVGRGNTHRYKLTLEKGSNLPPFEPKREKVASTEKVAPRSEKVASEPLKGGIAMQPEPSENHQEPSGSRRDAKASPAQKNWFTFFCDLANQLDVIVTPEDRQQTAKHFKDLRKNEPTEAEMKKVVSKILEARTSGFSMSPQKALDKVRGGNVYPLRPAASSTATPEPAVSAIRGHDTVKRYASLASRWDFTSDEAPDWTVLKELGGDPSEQHKNLKRLQRVARQAMRGEAV